MALWCALSSHPWQQPSLLSPAVSRLVRPVVPFQFCHLYPAQKNMKKCQMRTHDLYNKQWNCQASKKKRKEKEKRLTWKNCSSFSRLQKKGCLRTLSAEGLICGSILNIFSIRSLATMSPKWHRHDTLHSVLTWYDFTAYFSWKITFFTSQNCT